MGQVLNSYHHSKFGRMTIGEHDRSVLVGGFVGESLIEFQET